jgi:hypothetical protein
MVVLLILTQVQRQNEWLIMLLDRLGSTSMFWAEEVTVFTLSVAGSTAWSAVRVPEKYNER